MFARERGRGYVGGNMKGTRGGGRLKCDPKEERPLMLVLRSGTWENGWVLS